MRNKLFPIEDFDFTVNVDCDIDKLRLVCFLIFFQKKFLFKKIQ